MKIRQGFVSNSSSSSFVIITAGGKTIVEDGNTDMETCGSCTFPIDEMIAALVAAKENGVTDVAIYHGGGYDG